MPRENKTQYALLGVLMYGPFSGYEIKKMIDNSIGFFWTENYGHIYPVLASLEKRGLVTKAKIQQEKKPAKNSYAITEKGREYFADWLKADAEYEKIRHELLLKVFFGGLDSKNRVKRKLTVERKLHEKLLKKYEKVEKHMEKGHANHRHKKYWLMTLEYGRRYSWMAIEWCGDMIKTIQDQ